MFQRRRSRSLGLLLLCTYELMHFATVHVSGLSEGIRAFVVKSSARRVVVVGGVLK